MKPSLRVTPTSSEDAWSNACVRLNILGSPDPVPLVQEIAAENAHGQPPSETVG
jgi:hypothetical protein